MHERENIQNKLTEKARDNITSILDDYHIPWFVGGSRRFGYYNGFSDVDLFILLPEEDCKFVKSFLIYLVKFYNPSSYIGCIDQYSLFDGRVHLNVYPYFRKEEFTTLKTEHQIMQEFFTSPTIRFATAMKANGIKGATIYKVIKTFKHLSGGGSL